MPESDGTDGTGAATGGSRTRPKEAVRWVLLTGSRRLLAVLLLVTILLSLVTIGTVWELEMQTLVDETRAVQTLFNTLLGGIILFVSVVLSINTAVISDEFGPLETKQSHVEESIEFQTELEGMGTGISPAGFGDFYLFVLETLDEEADTLRREAKSILDEGDRGDVVAIAEDVQEEVALIEERIQSSDRSLSAVVVAGLDYDYARHINAVRRLRATRGDRFPEPVRQTLDDLISVLTIFASGREYFTTLYYKREVRALSGDLLVLSLPVIVFTSFVLLAIDAGLFPSFTVFDIQRRLLYVSIAFVVALSPYVLLSAYMVRILTVSKHSLDPGGFTAE
ncbi:hypothetical protein [Halostella pelagica]|uniref:hypothetical protein n=1 Tax=Halostella pelagica TaxID=2583824 RepID=UPI00192A1AB4|nr:hypothetical protein [Halostella pelagica]